ncbi:MAG: SH3 domain-containing protein [Eubacteriales bacterium]|nr:SH3 domain-containing protein [Eubacteriales bacterium]
MKKAILLIITFVLLITGCSNFDLFGDLMNNSKESVLPTEQDLTPSDTLSADGALSKEDDVENNLNLSPLSEDMRMTKEAGNYNITEYNVLTDAFDLNPEDIIPGEVTNVSDFAILEKYDPKWPEVLINNLLYDRYDIAFDYILAMANDINIRSKPSLSGTIVGRTTTFQKYNAIAKVQGQYLESYADSAWYEVMWKDTGTLKKGYVFGKLVEKRTFDFDKMISYIDEVRDRINNNKTAYIANYKDRNGEAPAYDGGQEDAFGTKRYGSAPAYLEASLTSEFRYLPDGTIVLLLAKQDGFYKVGTLLSGGEYYVPEGYISGRNAVEELTQLVVVDIANQNEAVFHYFRGEWQVVSITYVSTASQGLLIEPDKPACYKIIEKKEKIEFLGSDTDAAVGYAPYAVRFGGGNYNYGVPVEYEITDGISSDPGEVEYLYTMGTLPRTASGIRNYTSHAKFLHDWLIESKSAVIILP